MSRVFITGANGFVGSNLCRWFRDRGWEVDGLVRESSDLHFLRGLDVRLVKGDLREAEKIDLPAGTTHIVHAASLVSDTAGDEDCARNIFDMTRSFVRRVRTSGIPLERFVHISTALTLGFDGRDISEERPGRSAAFLPYTRHKIRTENELRDVHARVGFPVVILRPGDVFGPNDRVTSARLLQSCERGLPLVVGHGRWRFGYCHVTNLCRAAESGPAHPGDRRTGLHRDQPRSADLAGFLPRPAARAGEDTEDLSAGLRRPGPRPAFRPSPMPSGPASSPSSTITGSGA